MTRRVRFRAAWFLGTMVVAALAACSSNNSCTQVLGPGQTLAGTYRVDSNAVNTIAGTPIPGVTGGAVLTDSIYSVTLNIPGLGTIPDSGTYRISCNTISERSVLSGTQLTGTFAVAGDTLTVRGSVSGQQELLIFLKKAGP